MIYRSGLIVSRRVKQRDIHSLMLNLSQRSGPRLTQELDIENSFGRVLSHIKCHKV